MEAAGDMEEALKVLDSSLCHAKWRLKPASKRRLETDVLALSTRMRPVVMVDYGGKMPELQERLCKVLKLMQKESPIFKKLRIMVIEDMIYLIHVEAIAEFASSSLNLEKELLFVDLEQDPPKMITQTGMNSVVLKELASVRKLFSLVFPLDGTNSECSQCHRTDSITDGTTITGELLISHLSEFIDLSHCLRETQITVPTLNGWLLGYPVVYLFSKEHIADAICNLSTKPLHLFKVLVRRNIGASCQGRAQEEELMSFSVPYDLSLDGNSEAWAQVFEAHMHGKWEICKQVWSSFRMEVSACYPQAIVL